MRILVAALILIPLVSACTTQTIETTNVRPPEKSYASVTVGEIRARTGETQTLVPFFRTALIDELKQEAKLSAVIDGVDNAPPEDGFKFSGELTEIDLGSAAARIIIGFGAGSQSIHGHFQMTDSEGTVLAAYASHESYAGGAGIGGFSALSIQELAQKFGRSTASVIAKWMRKETITEEPSEFK